jgi:hypothetical protein
VAKTAATPMLKSLLGALFNVLLLTEIQWEVTA